MPYKTHTGRLSIVVCSCGKGVARKGSWQILLGESGHGRRRKQAHDETHDWINIRRGSAMCGTTFTLLPGFSLPYTHYSLVARSQSLQRYCDENCSWENAAGIRGRPGGERH